MKSLFTLCLLIYSSMHHSSFFLQKICVIVVLSFHSFSVFAKSPFFLGGIFIDEPNLDHWVQTIKKANLDTVEITVWARQQKWDSADILDQSINEEKLAQIRAAKKAGLQVVFVSRVLLDHAIPENQFLWHGSIFPKTEQDLDAWFLNYGDIVSRWAQICEQEGVDLFVIGSEMNAMVATLPIRKHNILTKYYTRAYFQAKRRDHFFKFSESIPPALLNGSGYVYDGSPQKYINRQLNAQQKWAEQVSFLNEENSIYLTNRRRAKLLKHWRKLIKKVRSDYTGLLSYAANHDSYDDIGFWDQLDLIGLNGYFPLRGKDQHDVFSKETITTFDETWEGILSEIKEFQTKQHIETKPILFTELGYNDRQLSTIEPWRGYGFSILGKRKTKLVLWRKQAVDLEERTQALHSLRRAIQEQNLPFAGILYWKLTTNIEHKAFEAFTLSIDTRDKDPSLSALSSFLEFKKGNY